MPEDVGSVSAGEVRELKEMSAATDTRDYLAAAARQAARYEDYELIVDTDAHLQEGRFFGELLSFMENDVLRDIGETQLKAGLRTPLINMQPGMSFQSLSGRVPHQSGPGETVDEPDTHGHPFAQIMRRSIDAMGCDYQVIFPTAMLHLGMNPMEDIEIYMARAYCRWLTEMVLPEDKRFIGLAYLPFNNVDECERIVREFGANPQIVGFTICAVRHKPVWHNQYMRLYSMIEETGKPLVFHAGPHWDDPSFAQLNRFVSMHALSFVHYNLIHMTNWIVNAMPERFPQMKVLWVESGLAWIPYLMQRLDHEVLLRPSEAPGLKRMPSEYMQDMYYTSQPMESWDLKMLEATMEKMKAPTQLLYASDWPHWDFDPPGSIANLPFLSQEAKKNILGLNAAKLFNLPVKRLRPRAADILAQRAPDRIS
ncbi:MAG: amidohydrolase family protein [Beijerinckiaceae bacterium]